MPFPAEPFHWSNLDTFIHRDPDIIGMSLVVQAEKTVIPRVIHESIQKVMEMGSLMDVETHFYSSIISLFTLYQEILVVDFGRSSFLFF